MTAVQQQETIVHATSVALDGGIDTGVGGILLRGPSGSGKSDLALRLIDGGGRLIADDHTVLRRVNDQVLLSAPAAIRGCLEVRGLGVVPVAAVDDIVLVLIVDLVPPGDIERLPLARFEPVLEIAIPRLALAPFEASAAPKVRLAARAAACGIMDQLD